MTKWVDHLGRFNPKGSGGSKQHNDVRRDEMDAKTRQSAPLLAREGTVDSRLTQTVEKGTKTVLKRLQTTRKDSRTNKRNHYNFTENMDENPGSRGIKNSGDE